MLGTEVCRMGVFSNQWLYLDGIGYLLDVRRTATTCAWGGASRRSLGMNALIHG